MFSKAMVQDPTRLANVRRCGGIQHMGSMSNESNFSKKRASTRHAPQIIPTRSRRLGYVIPPKHTIGVLVAPTPLDRSPPLAAVASAFSFTVASGK